MFLYSYKHYIHIHIYIYIYVYIYVLLFELFLSFILYLEHAVRTHGADGARCARSSHTGWSSKMFCVFGQHLSGVQTACSGCSNSMFQVFEQNDPI